ncbi:MAG: hypothetical protein Q6356_002560 [Candidatus Wukongarchaeota archaeon]|nr:hypothetical protein [Candidatus Wukongarchaeota archaeon]
MVNLFSRSKKKNPKSNTKETYPQIQPTTPSATTSVSLPPTIQSQQPIIITQQQEDYVVTWAFMNPEKDEIGSKPSFSGFSKQKTKPAFNNDLNEYQSTSTPSSNGFSNPRLDMLNEIRQKLGKRRKMIEESE